MIHKTVSILVNNKEENFIQVEENKFSFHLTSSDGTGKAEGYCNLSDEEYKTFLGVFNRMAGNVEKIN